MGLQRKELDSFLASLQGGSGDRIPYPSIDQPLGIDTLHIGGRESRPRGRWLSLAKSDLLRRLTLHTVTKEFTRKLENHFEGTLWVVPQDIYSHHHHKFLSPRKLLFGCCPWYVTAFIGNETVSDGILNGSLPLLKALDRDYLLILGSSSLFLMPFIFIFPPQPP